MSVKDQVIQYMEAHNYNKADVARLSGVPYTTIDGIFKKGDENCKLSTLKKLSKLLNCSLDDLVGLNGGNDNYTVHEKMLVLKYRSLDDANKTALLFSIDVLLTSQEERKKTTSA